MVPFMETQSAALAYAFGLNYEAGKRKIKSMDNETFNALTPEDIANMSANQTKVQIDNFIKQIPSFMEFQKRILDHMVVLEGEKFKLIPKIIAEIGDSTWELIFGESKRLDELEEKTNPTDSRGDRGGDKPPLKEPAIAPIPTQPPPTPKRGTSQETKDKKIIDSLVSALGTIEAFLKTKAGQNNMAMKNQAKNIITSIFNNRVKFKNNYGYWY